MKSRDEMIHALKDRIKQIDESLEVIPFSNSSYWRQEAISEELHTFLAWAEDSRDRIILRTGKRGVGMSTGVFKVEAQDDIER